LFAAGHRSNYPFPEPSANPQMLTAVIEVKRSGIEERKKSNVSTIPLGKLNTLTSDEVHDMLM
jgi:hypothetical protein